MRRFIITPLLLGLTACLAPTLAHAQESLERGLLKEAPKLIKYFQKQGYKNVGVLKFMVTREGTEGWSDNVGTLNTLAARRLELALILANDPRTPVNIINNASDVAQKIPGANHLKKDGRLKLFAAKYPLAWGTEMVEPDAFVTGIMQISKDLRMLKLSLLCFDNKANELGGAPPPPTDLQVANATDRLSEMNESFILRGAFDDGTAETTVKNQEKVYQEAKNVYEQKAKHPVRRDDQPVTLEVRYDGRVIPCEVRGGKAFIPEPNEGQRVEFGLRRDNVQERYGVVLKVNGENTLDKERFPDASCRKWILAPGEGPWVIRGYQLGNNRREDFRVASAAEAKTIEMYYGRDVGTITMCVFRERKGKVKPKLESDEERSQTVIQKLPEIGKADTYGALKAQLLEEANKDRDRGYIVPGQNVESNVQRVSFNADPNPIMCLTIVYYRR